jgi:hypothetical protein
MRALVAFAVVAVGLAPRLVSTCGGEEAPDDAESKAETDLKDADRDGVVAADLLGLEGFMSMGRNLNARSRPALTSLLGLERLTLGGDDLDIRGDDALREGDVDALIAPLSASVGAATPPTRRRPPELEAPPRRAPGL